MNTTKIGNIEITSDGKTVWVNGKNGCLARFGPHGFEVEGRISLSSDVTNEIGWRRFVYRVERECDIVIPEIHKPKFLTAGNVAAAEVEGCQQFDSRQEGFRNLLSTAKVFCELHAGYTEKQLRLYVQGCPSAWLTPAMAQLVLSFRDAVQKAEGA